MLLKILTTITALSICTVSLAAQESFEENADRDPAANKIHNKKTIERTASAETGIKEESTKVRTTRSSKAF